MQMYMKTAMRCKNRQISSAKGRPLPIRSLTSLKKEGHFSKKYVMANEIVGEVGEMNVCKSCPQELFLSRIDRAGIFHKSTPRL